MDIDNDGDQEIMCVTESNEIHFYHHDGVSFENFPYISYHSIYSMPAVGDIDDEGFVFKSNGYQIPIGELNPPLAFKKG